MQSTNVMDAKTTTILIFAPAAKLKMVMDGRHLEDALAVRQLEIRHL